MAPPELAMRKAWEVLQDETPQEFESFALAIQHGVRCLEDADARGYTAHQVAPLAQSVIKASELYLDAKFGYTCAKSWVPGYSQIKWSTGVFSSRMRARERELRAQITGLVHDPPPAAAPRRCTDLGCCFVFLVAVALLGYIVKFAYDHGNVKRLTAIPDYQGNLCGVSDIVKDRPLLFFCQEPSGTLLYDFPICVSQCPDPRNLQGVEVGCPEGSAPSYKSRPFLDVLCVRAGGDARTAQADQEASWHWESGTAQVMERTAMVKRAWMALVVPAGVAALLGLLYLLLLQRFPLAVAWTGLVTFSLVWGAIGGLMIWISQQKQQKVLPGREAPVYFLICGIILVIVSVMSALVACLKRHAIRMAAGPIKSACEVITDMPTLIIEPFVALLTYASALLFLFIGFVQLMSCAHREKEGNSTFVDLKYGPKETGFLVYYVFAALWILELCNSLSMFAIAHAAQQWFFASTGTASTGKEITPCAGIVSWFVGVRSHIGSLAFGSLIILILRPLRVLLNTVMEAISMDNVVGRCTRKTLTCFVAWYERTLLFVSKTAFIDVAVHGSGFFEATEHTKDLLVDSATQAADLHGATWFCQVAGMGGISAIGGGITYLMARRIPMYADVASISYVPDPWFLSFISALICMVVAWPFMLVFADTSDTILFCFALERQRHHRMDQEWGSDDLNDMSAGFMYFLGMHDDDELVLQTNKVSRDHPPETQALLRSTLTAKLAHGMRSLSTVTAWRR